MNFWPFLQILTIYFGTIDKVAYLSFINGNIITMIDISKQFSS